MRAACFALTWATILVLPSGVEAQQSPGSAQSGSAQSGSAAPAVLAPTAPDPSRSVPPVDGRLRIVGSDTQYDIILPTDLLFDFDKSALRPEAFPLLAEVKRHLDAHGSSQLHIKGYTDSKGSDQYNFRLSMRRAAAVCDWLKARGQAVTNCIGRGEQDPIAPNTRPDGGDDPAGRQQNRRVTISVVKYPDANAMMQKAREQARGASGR